MSYWTVLLLAMQRIVSATTKYCNTACIVRFLNYRRLHSAITRLTV
jgi:hypothetical protein